MQYIGKLDRNKMGKYGKEAITDEVILTDERFYEHILVKHLKEYQELKNYLKEIIENPDIMLEDNRKEDTLLVLKQITEIQRNARVVVKIAVAKDEQHPKNSIITLMELNDRTWKQTLKNRGNVIFNKM